MKKDIRAYGYEELQKEMATIRRKSNFVQNRFMNGCM